MRYEKSSKIQDENGSVEREVAAEPVMKPAGDDFAGRLQAAVVNAGGRTLNILEAGGHLPDGEGEAEKKARAAIRDLKDFHYSLGFAGEQSTGKSTVINAMIQYPLMPTCLQATTCTPVDMIYSEKIRVVVTDDDTGETVMDRLCSEITAGEFRRLAEYTCAVSTLGAIENLQPFTEKNVCDELNGLRPEDLDMDRSEPKHTAVLLLILLTVYVKQNQKELTEKEKRVNQLRKDTLRFFGIDPEIINISVLIQWDAPMLRDGLKIVDLPGLGADAADKKLENGTVLKGHDTITKEAISRTDTMVFLNTPEVTAAALPALEEMLSNLELREVVDPGKCVIPVMNKDDACKGELDRQAALETFSLTLANKGIKKGPEDIWRCSALYGEYDYLDLEDKSRTLYFQTQMKDARKKGMPEEMIQRKKNGWIEDLEYAYKQCGIKELREFFRTAFAERGKLEKSFSTIASLKALYTEISARLDALISADAIIANTSREMAETTLDQLEESAGTPIRDTIREIGKVVEKKQRRASVVNEMLEKAVFAYVDAFRSSLREYIEKNTAIAKRLEGSLNPLHWNDVRIDSGHAANYATYQELLATSRDFTVSMVKVNKSYVEALEYCSADIEDIYGEATRKMQQFRSSYEEVIRSAIDVYRDRASREALDIVDGMIPVILQFVEQMVEEAEAGIEEKKDTIKAIGKEISAAIMNENAKFVSAHSQFLLGRVENMSKGYFFEGHCWLKLDGSDGLLQCLQDTNLTASDENVMKEAIRQTCQERITEKMQDWYTNALTDMQGIFYGLQEKLRSLFLSTKELLNKDANDRQPIVDGYRRQLEEVNGIFTDMRGQMREEVRSALEMQKDINYSETVSQWFEISV